MLDFTPLLEQYTKRYINDKEKFIEFLVNSIVPKQCLESLYRYFVNTNELEPLESLTIDRKTEIWEKVKGKISTRREAVMICRGIYLMEEIIKP